MANSRDEAASFAVNGKGYVCSGYSGTSADATLWEFDPNAVGVTETQNEILISVFPNPSKGEFTVYGLQSSVELSFYDCIGNKIFTKTTNNIQENINMNRANSGIYFYKIVSHNKTTSTGKIIIE